MIIRMAASGWSFGRHLRPQAPLLISSSFGQFFVQFVLGEQGYSTCHYLLTQFQQVASQLAGFRSFSF